MVRRWLVQVFLQTKVRLEGLEYLTIGWSDHMKKMGINIKLK